MTDPVPPIDNPQPNANTGGNSGEKTPRDVAKLLRETFSQEELDKLFAERATQAKSSALTDLFKTLGVESADTLKAVIKKAQEADEANKSELQKAQDKAANAEKAVTDQKATFETQIAEQRATFEAQIQRLEKLLTDTEIKIAAAQAVKDKDGKVTRAAFRADALDDVVVLINRKEIKREGGATSGIEDALAELAKAKTFLLEAEPVMQFKGSPADSKLRKPNTPKSTENDDKSFFKSL